MTTLHRNVTESAREPSTTDQRTEADGSKADGRAASASSPLPASTKIYVHGTIHKDIRVPMREISLSTTQRPDDSRNANDAPTNPALAVYDTSGPYTDPDVAIDVRVGLPPIRLDWISHRGDVEAYAGRTVRPEDNGRASLNDDAVERFPDAARRLPLRAR